MTRQSLSRFLSDRRELRTFMTLPFKAKSRPKRPSSVEARKLCKPPTPVNPPNPAKKGGFPPKILQSGVAFGNDPPHPPSQWLATPCRPVRHPDCHGLRHHRAQATPAGTACHHHSQPSRPRPAQFRGCQVRRFPDRGP